jgi:hypothetical protein
MMAIRHLIYKEIDHDKWDACIRNSSSALIYAYAWFLDIVSPQWEALVLNDYEAVMPLTKRKKVGINYLCQPPFCAELGVFSIQPLNQELVDQMLGKIPKKFLYIDICLNRSNHLFSIKFPLRLRKNHVLWLGHPYEQIVKNYAENHKRNIKKANSAGLYHVTDIPIEEAIQMTADTLKEIAPMQDQDRRVIKDLFVHAGAIHKVICAGVRDQNNTLLSVAVFFFEDETWYYLLAGSTVEGRSKGAAHFLIDQFIKEHAGRDQYLDFEGSDLPSLAFFYKGFGADEQLYPAVIINKLPWWLKWIKGS